MKIVKLEAENVKRLRAIEITPEGSTVVISGRNGQGKTSVLDSIWFALGGGPAARDTARPVREGEDHASVRLDLGSLIVTRTWSADGKTRLTVDSPDGARFRSPQAMLDELVGRLSFDPLGFSQLPDREQRATLLDLIELPFDPEELERERAGLFDGRTEVNRQAKALEAQLAGMPEPPEDLPDEEISSAEILAAYNAAQQRVRENEAVRNARSHAEVEVQRREKIAEDAARALQEAQEATKRALAAWSDAQLAEARLDPDPDLSAFEEKLATAEQTNEAIRAAQHRSRTASEFLEARASSEAFTAKLDAIEKRKVGAIEAAKMPIEGLAFDADGVLYRGVPFKQASSAEQLRVSLAMAMALNPSLRVIRITDGSLLDSENIRLIEEMASEHDYQVWIEVVDESGKLGIVIEDGAIVEPAEVEA